MSYNFYAEIYDTYHDFLLELGQDIEDEMGEGEVLDGDEWCMENGVPATMFAHAIQANYEKFDYGVSPMLPWLKDHD